MPPQLPSSKVPTMRDAFVSTLSELAQKDESILLLTGDLGFGVLADFAERFPAQFINAGIAEQNMTALACGLALEGYQVYTYSIGNFPTLRCLEQIRNDICYHDANVTIVSVGAGFSYGQLGMSHFATEDLAILRALPNLQVIAPSDAWEAAELTRQMASSAGPKYLRLDKSNAGAARAEASVSLGKARVLRQGNDVTIIGIGGILAEALAAADALANSSLSCRVLAIHSLKPLDSVAIVAAAAETGGIITVEEHSMLGGLGGAVAEICLANGTPPRAFRRIGINDIYPEVVGDQAYLRHRYGLTARALSEAAIEMVRSA